MSPAGAHLPMRVSNLVQRVTGWYARTPAGARVGWGGLTACAALGIAVIANRLVALRRRKVLPREFERRYLARLREGRLDREKALDLCAMNPSAGARVVQAGAARSGRTVTEIEAAITRTVRLETNRLSNHLGTLWRIAALAPLFGLLGAVSMLRHAVSSPVSGGMGLDLATALGQALGPVSAGVALAILALAAYDGLTIRVENLARDLDHLGTETLEAAELGLIVEGNRLDRGHRPPNAPGAPTNHLSHAPVREREEGINRREDARRGPGGS